MKKHTLIGRCVTLGLTISMVAVSAKATPTVTGDVVYSGQLVSGTNLKHGQHENADVQVYLESSETLSSALFVDELPTAFDTSGDISSGTAIADYLIHYDYPGTSGGNNASGTITFGSAIIGLIITQSTLNATDSILGVGGVTYPSGGGLEAKDDWSVSGNQLTFNISDWTTTSGVDEVRVILATPDRGSTIALLGLSVGLLGILGWRKKTLA